MRTVRVVHRGEEFFLIDDEAGREGRTVTVVVLPDKEPGHLQHPGLLIPTDKGIRALAARWVENRVEPLLDVAPERMRVYEEVLDKYLNDRLQGRKGQGKPFYFNYRSASAGYQFALARSHPHGLAVNIYGSRILADQRARDQSADGNGFETRRTHDLWELLTRAANEGYAGAILDDSDPIYFCVDDKEQIQFMRLSQDEDDEIEETFLDPSGAWLPRLDSGGVEIWVDQEACDRKMVAALGDVPFLPQTQEGDLPAEAFVGVETPGDPGRPMAFPLEGVESALQEERMTPVFHNRRTAVEFIADRVRADLELVTIADLKGFIERAGKDGLTVMLEPGNHRALGGIFWLNGDDVILDSFSGLWVMNAEREFVHLP